MKQTMIHSYPTVRQFDIWFANLPKKENSHVQGGTRPVIIVSNNTANKFSPVITIIPLTSRIDKRPLPTHVSLYIDGLTARSLALCEQLTTIDKHLLTSRVGAVDSLDRAALNRALAIQFGTPVA